MTTRKLNTHLRQEQIVRAAIEIIARQGLQNLSVTRLAREVGLVPSALYRHYESKDDVIEAVLDQVGANLRRILDQARAETPDLLESLHRLLLLHLQMVCANRNLPGIVLSEDIYLGHPERKRRMYRNIEAYLEGVAGIVRQGQQAGVIRTDAAASDLAVMFLGLVQPAAILLHMSDGEFDAEGHVESAWAVFRDALRCSGSRDKGETKAAPKSRGERPGP